MKKKLISFISLLVITSSLFAQVNITLNGLSNGDTVNLNVNITNTNVSDTSMYREFACTITQSGEDSLVMIVKNNTLGFTPTISRTTTGRYEIVYAGGFADRGKVFLIGMGPTTNGGFCTMEWQNEDTIRIQTYGADFTAREDGKLESTDFKIIIYK